MRVRLVSPASRDRVGFTRYTEGLAAGLGEIGVEVETVGVPKTEWRIAGRPFLGDTLLRLRARRLPPADGVLVHAAEPTLAAAADVVTVHDAIAWKADPSWLPGPLGRLYGRRKLAALHDRDVVVPTEAVRRDLAGLGFDAEKVTVTSEGVDLGRFHPGDPDPAMDAPGFHVLLVGDMNPRKGWELVLQAAAFLPDVHVWHVGPVNGWTKHHEHVQALGRRLGGRWHPLAAVADLRLRALYAACDLLALPSEDEGFGLPPVEAMACGAPVLVSDAAVFDETVGTFGRHTPRTVEAVRLALADEQREGPPSSASQRRKHAATFTWKRAAKRTAAVYERAGVSKRHERRSSGRS